MNVVEQTIVASDHETAAMMMAGSAEHTRQFAAFFNEMVECWGTAAAVTVAELANALNAMTEVNTLTGDKIPEHLLHEHSMALAGIMASVAYSADVPIGDISTALTKLIEWSRVIGDETQH